MINRIKEIAAFYSLTSTGFADQVEIPRPVISHIFSERNKPSLEVVQKIGAAFPEVRLEWLLYGWGEMLKSSEAAPETPVLKKPEAVNPVPTSEPEKQLALEWKSEIAAPPVQTPEPAKHPAPAPTRRAVKIVFIYDDQTFEEFRP